MNRVSLPFLLLIHCLPLFFFVGVGGGRGGGGGFSFFACCEMAGGYSFTFSY